jgi:hypothetical protein
MNNKKVIIVAHSMSNLRTSFMLWNAEQAWKDKYIQNYFAIAPTWIGSPLVISFLTCGNEDYTFPLHMGFDWPTFKKTVSNFTSMW